MRRTLQIIFINIISAAVFAAQSQIQSVLHDIHSPLQPVSDEDPFGYYEVRWIMLRVLDADLS